jgi:hypothetical protein
VQRCANLRISIGDEAGADELQRQAQAVPEHLRRILRKNRQIDEHRYNGRIRAEMLESNISGPGRTGRAKQLSEECLNCCRRAYVCRSVVRNAWYWRAALMRKAMHCPSVDDEL